MRSIISELTQLSSGNWLVRDTKPLYYLYLSQSIDDAEIYLSNKAHSKLFTLMESETASITNVGGIVSTGVEMLARMVTLKSRP